MDYSVKISVIIPVYNAEKYIRKCIKSLIEQTYSNLEIIIINDGSKDNTLEIIKSYSKLDNRIIIINQENRGPSIARNVGIDRAKGDYIVFIDADDHVELNYIENMVDHVNVYNSDMVICNYIETRDLGNIYSDIFTFIEENKKYGFDNKCLGEVLSGRGGLVWGKLFKVSIIKEKSLRFNSNISMCEDLLFCLDFIIHSNIITKLNKYLYIHNKQNENSITTKYNKNLFIEQVEVQNLLREFIEKNNLYTTDTDLLLNERLKGIMWFSIYKEIINKSNLKVKLSNIKNIINNEIIVSNISKFSRNGPIDKAILFAIQIRQNMMVYLISILRIKISNIRLKISSSNI